MNDFFHPLVRYLEKKRTNLNVQIIESMIKIYCYTLSTHDQKSLNHIGIISNDDIKLMLDKFEEGDLLNKDDDNDELIPDEHEKETADINETLDVDNRIELEP